MEDVMDKGVRWFAVFAMLVMIAAVGVVTYNLGVAQGATAIAAPAPGAVAPMFYYYPRHWGWGFGFFPFFGLFWVFLFFGFMRRLWWGPRWYRRGCGYGYYGYYDHDRVPPEFEEWHRRAHGQQPPPTTTQL
jgi:hypothetical protein